MRILTLPGVYRPRSDSALLRDAVAGAGLPPQARVLELCTGSGVVGLSVAARGHDVTAVDVSRRAAWTARLNALLNVAKVGRDHFVVRRGDLFGTVAGERFEAIVANPPYLPAASDGPSDGVPTRGAARAWDAGADGRAVIDRICREAPSHLTRGGALYLLQSSLADIDATHEALSRAGFVDVEVIADHHGPLGPIAAARAAHLVSRGHDPADEERLAVIRATWPGQAQEAASRSAGAHGAQRSLVP